MTSRWLLALIAVCGWLAGSAGATESPLPCAGAEFHKFDFWIGDWDTFDLPITDGSTSIARNHVEAILEHCVIHEDYSQFDGHHGQSFTIYDASRKVWHQSWVTNRGELLVLEGSRSGDRITLEGDRVMGKDKQRIRVLWYPRGSDVRETATLSADGGRTWKPLFDILFRKHKD